MNATSTTPQAKRRVLRLWTVDDHAALRQSFAHLLNTDPRLRVTRQFASIQPLLDALAEERPPDVILLDINIGRENGLTAIAPVRKLAPKVKVVMLTTFNNTHSESEAFKLGASGFLLKIYEPDELMELIHQAYYHPKDRRLFPTMHQSVPRGSVAAKKCALPSADERPGLFNMLRQLYRKHRRPAASPGG